MSPDLHEFPSGNGFPEAFAHAARPVASSSEGRSIRLSVVLIGTHSLQSVRRTIGELLAQTHAGETELLLASESDALLAEAAAWLGRDNRLGAWQLFSGDTGHTPLLRLACTAHARGDLVVYTEDHTFQPPDWAAGLIRVFDACRDAVAVSPCLRNAAPQTAVSRVQYAFFTAGAIPVPGQLKAVTVPRLPWHNTAYRTSQLRQVVREAWELEMEASLHESLLRTFPGSQLLLARGTEISHLYMGRLWPALRMAFHGGILVGDWLGTRCGSNRGRTLLRAAGFPAVAARRIATSWNRLTDGTPPQVAANLATATLIALTHAIGEAWGSCFGAGDATRAYSDLEVRRDRFVGPHERALLLP